MSRVNDGVAQSPYPSLKAFHDEVGVTGGDSWDEFYNTYRFGYDPSDLELGDRMARFWDSPANSIYARATFALDARRTPGVPAAGNTTMDLGPNALRVQNGTTGSAAIVQDGRGGKAVQFHGVAGARAYGASWSGSGVAGTGTSVVVHRARFSTEVLVPSSNISVTGATSGRFGILVTNSGYFRLQVKTVAGSDVAETPTTNETLTSIGYTPGRPMWVEFTHDQSTGVCTGRYSLTDTADPDAASWTAFTFSVDTTTTGVYSSITSVGVATINLSSSSPFLGKVHRAQWYVDGTLLTDFNPSLDASFTSTTFTSTVGANTGQWQIDQLGSDNSDATYMPAPSTLGVDRYVYLPGIAGNFLSAPDEAALDITGDIDLRVHCALDDWTPAAISTLVSKWTATGNQRSYSLQIATNGRPVLNINTDGATGQVSFPATASPSVSDGEAIWVRATLDVDNGSSQSVATFYTSDDGISWTQLGSPVVGAVVSIFAGTAVLEVGSLNVGTTQFGSGRFFRAQVYDGIDGSKVFDWSAEDTVTATHTTYTASTGQTVTVNRATSGRKTVVVEAAKWALGTDDYLEVPDNALLDLDAATDFTVLAVVRQHATPTSFGRYVTKYDVSAASTGWGVMTNGTNLNLYASVDDGPDVAQRSGLSTITAGQLSTIGLRVLRSDGLATFTGGTLSASASMASVGDCSNTKPVSIGRNDGGTNYQDFELYAVYIWREALSAAELAAIAADWGAA